MGEGIMKLFSIVTLLALLLLAACVQVEKPVEKVKIGVTLPRSGPATATAIWAHNGIELALEKLTQEERNRIELIEEDDQCSPTQGMTVAQKLAEVDNVKFVIGPLCAAVMSPTNDYYDSHEIIRIGVGAAMESYKTSGKYKFVFFGKVADLAGILGEYLNKKNIQTLAIIYLDDDYGKQNLNTMEQVFKGTIVAKEHFARGDSDFRTQLLKIKETEPEAVFYAAYGSTLVNLLKQSAELDIQGMKLSLYNTEDPEIVKSAGSLIEGIIYPHISDKTESEIKTWFEQRYLEKYGQKNEAISANAFDSFNILLDAIKNCNEDTDCVRSEIMKVKDYVGASGKFSADEFGLGTRSPTIKIIKNGEFIYAESTEASK